MKADVQVITQRNRNGPDLGIIRRQKMRAAEDKMDRLTSCTLGRLDDLFDSWMTAPHNENNPVGRIDLAPIADGLA
jgi:hypothetical protein